MAKYLEKMYSGQKRAVKKVEEKAKDKVKESLWEKGKNVAKDFWEGKNAFGSKVGNRATAIGVPALAATAGTVYALRKKAAKAAAAADELEAAATEQNFSEHIYSDAFEAGYMYAQREFADEEEALRDEYEREMKKRKKKRIGGHVMGALGTAGVLNHGISEFTSPKLLKEVVDAAPDETTKNAIKKGYNIGKWGSRGLGLGAAALTAGGLYRINKKANKKMTYEDWLAEKDSQNED